MFSSFSAGWKKIWSTWNIRGVILFSLFLQIFLIVSAPSRKRTRSGFVLLVWLAYLLADWAASYCVGLISKNEHAKSATATDDDYLLAFWGPFLLLHLGGQDTISAFALEDNELWLRHLLSLIFQFGTAFYVFFLTFSRNKLLVPTILLFVAGLIKYAERIRALNVAAINNFRKSLVQKPDAGPNYAKLMEEHDSRQQAGLPVQIIAMPELGHGRDKNHQGSNGVSHVEKVQIKCLEEAQKAYYFFQKFQGLIVDMIYSSSDRRESQEYFGGKEPEEALRVIEIELNFMYEFFYTKASLARHWSWSLGKMVSFSSVVVALALFILAEKHSLDKLDVKVTYALLYGALALDVMALIMRIFTDYTATLCVESPIDFFGASWFQSLKVSFFKRFDEKILVRFLMLRMPTWTKLKEGPYKDCHQLSTCVLFRRWCGSISGHNLLRYCLDESVPRVPNKQNSSSIAQAPDQNSPSNAQATNQNSASNAQAQNQNKSSIAEVIRLGWFNNVLFIQASFYGAAKFLGGGDLVNQWKYKDTNPFLRELWEHIFKELKDKADSAEDVKTIQSICSARGDGVVKKNKEIRNKLKAFVDPNEVAFDESLLLWHIATNLCYANDEGGGQHKREFSMLLSDYMLYLLMMQPNMMSAVAGIGQKRFQDTCEEAKRFFKKRNLKQEIDREVMQKEACKLLMRVPTKEKPIYVKGDRSKSVLFDACRLAKELNDLGEDKKWEVIASVWVELVSYAASNCRPTAHVQLLSRGGELISFVWLLMVQLGLGKQFQIMAGDARAKLIVGK